MLEKASSQAIHWHPPRKVGWSIDPWHTASVEKGLLSTCTQMIQKLIKIHKNTTKHSTVTRKHKITITTSLNHITNVVIAKYNKHSKSTHLITRWIARHTTIDNTLTCKHTTYNSGSKKYNDYDNWIRRKSYKDVKSTVSLMLVVHVTIHLS